MVRVLVIGPTSRPWDEVADEVELDLRRLDGPGIEVAYRCTGTGPAAIRSAADAAAAAPGVVATARQAVREGYDGVIVDCTDDPGVDDADRELDVPVVGPGAALRAAVRTAPGPILWLSGDDLRARSVEDLLGDVGSVATVVLGGTGWSHVADELRASHPHLVVLDPLHVALDRCLERIGGGRSRT